MTDALTAAVPSRIVEGYLDPQTQTFILRFNPPGGGATQHIRLPLEDVAVLADMAGLGVRQQIAAADHTKESAVATSFDLAEIVGADAIAISFSRGAQPPAQIVLPKSLATRLMQSFQKLLPLIGGAAQVQ